MKKKYKKLELHIVVFDTDVLTTSTEHVFFFNQSWFE